MDTLSIWDYSSLTRLSALDFGASVAATSDDLTLRVVNDSDVYQAEDVTVSVDGTNSDQLWLSLDGESFAATVSVGDLPPGAASAPLWLRRVTASTATAGLCTAGLHAVPTGWTTVSDTPDSPANTPLDT